MKLRCNNYRNSKISNIKWLITCTRSWTCNNLQRGWKWCHFSYMVDMLFHIFFKAHGFFFFPTQIGSQIRRLFSTFPVVVVSNSLIKLQFPKIAPQLTALLNLIQSYTTTNPPRQEIRQYSSLTVSVSNSLLVFTFLLSLEFILHFFLFLAFTKLYLLYYLN